MAKTFCLFYKNETCKLSKLCLMQLARMELVGGFVLFGVLVYFLFVCFVSGSNKTVEIQSLNKE